MRFGPVEIAVAVLSLIAVGAAVLVVVANVASWLRWKRGKQTWADRIGGRWYE